MAVAASGDGRPPLLSLGEGYSASSGDAVLPGAHGSRTGRRGRLDTHTAMPRDRGVP